MNQSGSNHVVLTSIYTLTPTHCGVGSTSGAVDLPIARESHSGLPILPASGLKGAARAALASGMPEEDVNKLFGPKVEAADGLSAGALAFTEAHLLLFPVRSFVRPWLYVTAPCLIDRLNRDLRALGLDEMGLPLGVRPDGGTGPVAGRVLVSQEVLAKQALVLEDRIFPKENLVWHSSVEALAGAIADLLPSAEEDTRARIKQGLIVVADEDLSLLLEQCIPVQARVKLNEQKTTTGNGGNLWYEEHLPSDCLFTSFVMTRPGGSQKNVNELKAFRDAWQRQSYLQLGGNETVGMGLCWWTLQNSSNDGSSPSSQGNGSSRKGSAGTPSGQTSTSRAGAAALPPAVFTPPSRRPLSLSAARQNYVLDKLFGHRKSPEDLTTLLKGLPVQLRQQGLTVMIADLLRRNKGAERQVLDVLSQWLLKDCPLELMKEVASGEPLEARVLLKKLIREMQPGEVQVLQAEAAQLLEQSKRLAQAL